MKLGQKMSEGAAISKKTLKIAFSQVAAPAPELAPEASRLVVADLDLSGIPRLLNPKTVYESKDRSCVLEAQDFYRQRHQDDFYLLRAGGPFVGDGNRSGKPAR